MARPVARTESVTSEDSLLDFPIAYCEHKIFRDNGSYGKTNVHLTSWSDESTLPDGRLGPPSEFMDGGTATSNEVTAPGNVQITSEVGGKTKTSATVFENVPRSKVVGVTQEEVRRWIRGSCPQTDQLDVDTARMPTIVRTAIRPSMTPTLSSSEATSTEFTSESTGSSASYKSGSTASETFGSTDVSESVVTASGSTTMTPTESSSSPQTTSTVRSETFPLGSLNQHFYIGDSTPEAAEANIRIPTHFCVYRAKIDDQPTLHFCYFSKRQLYHHFRIREANLLSRKGPNGWQKKSIVFLFPEGAHFDSVDDLVSYYFQQIAGSKARKLDAFSACFEKFDRVEERRMQR